MFDKTKMLSALQWLAANPDSHTEGDLATTADHHQVSTLDPRATCFCALGRYAVEIGLDTDCMDVRLFGIAHEEDMLFHDVWVTNDYAVRNRGKKDALIQVGALFGISKEEVFSHDPDPVPQPA